jgi:hypothetical protein
MNGSFSCPELSLVGMVNVTASETKRRLPLVRRKRMLTYVLFTHARVAGRGSPCIDWGRARCASNVLWAFCQQLACRCRTRHASVVMWTGMTRTFSLGCRTGGPQPISEACSRPRFVRSGQEPPLRPRATARGAAAAAVDALQNQGVLAVGADASAW